MEFLSQSPAVILTNLKPDKNGNIFINSNKLNKNHTLLTIVAIDKQTWQIREHFINIKNEINITNENDEGIIEGSKKRHLNEEEKIEPKTKRRKLNDTTKDMKMDEDIYEDENDFKYAEVRLFPGLDVNKHFSEEREIILLNDKKEFVIRNFKNSQYHIFSSLKEIFGLYCTLSNNKNSNLLEEFSFLLNWNNFNENEKNEKFSKYFCHEFNFYLYMKDKNYFNKNIKYFIKNKLEKTFLDEWFLTECNEYDKREYLIKYYNFDNFNNLNEFEKILLGISFKNDEKYSYITESILLYFINKNKILKITPEKIKKIFNIVLSNQSNQNKRREFT